MPWVGLMGTAAVDHCGGPSEAGTAMKSGKATVILLLCMMLTMAVASPGVAGEQRGALLKQYWGTITSIRVDRCGKQPGLCEGFIILTRREGGDVTLAIRPGTWIKRGDRLVLMEELSVGNDIHVQAIEIAGEGSMRATAIDVMTPR
jgi:hypothetical protein